ncbi:hypothetical protein RHSIM_Rhsim10G0069500 [Rhododendron simsii]|uniref:peptide-methionine (S)-S-oxide reductase n=1 Tax=Rhododendron simsii TaxID=118357 RepID=A0A834GET3_RHOSS|nr:hypothetical protein RHSIM_Rhsim10G0069500 [Rhododendron simsii]
MMIVYQFTERILVAESFWDLEAAYGRVDGVVKTVTGYCGGSLRKPTYREVYDILKNVCEGRTGHTEAVKVTYDKRKVSYTSLCDAFWETHDPTNKEFLNFGISTHQRSVIFYSTEDERRKAQESKIRRQMKLNRRIVTKVIASDGADFFTAENQYQKYYLQKYYRIMAMDGGLVIGRLATFIETHELLKKTRLAIEEVIEDLS